MTIRLQEPLHSHRYRLPNIGLTYVMKRGLKTLRVIGVSLGEGVPVYNNSL